MGCVHEVRAWEYVHEGVCMGYVKPDTGAGGGAER